MLHSRLIRLCLLVSCICLPGCANPGSTTDADASVQPASDSGAANDTGANRTDLPSTVCSCVGKRCDQTDGCGHPCTDLCGADQACCSGECRTLRYDADHCDVCGNTCPPDKPLCVQGVCQGCTPDCDGRECGDDGCGGVCTKRDCDPNPPMACVSGRCLCIPQCDDRECGSDQCGGSCSPGCSAGMMCSDEGNCVCEPKCAGKECGPDGCGGRCEPDACDTGWHCSGGGVCVCDPRSCTQIGAQCGTHEDGCGGTKDCGSCGAGFTCKGGTCVGGTVTGCLSASAGCDKCGPDSKCTEDSDDFGHSYRACGGPCSADSDCPAYWSCSSGACRPGDVWVCQGKTLVRTRCGVPFGYPEFCDHRTAHEIDCAYECVECADPSGEMRGDCVGPDGAGCTAGMTQIGSFATVSRCVSGRWQTSDTDCEAHCGKSTAECSGGAVWSACKSGGGRNHGYCDCGGGGGCTDSNGTLVLVNGAPAFLSQFCGDCGTALTLASLAFVKIDCTDCSAIFIGGGQQVSTRLAEGTHTLHLSGCLTAGEAACCYPDHTCTFDGKSWPCMCTEKTVTVTVKRCETTTFTVMQ